MVTMPTTTDAQKAAFVKRLSAATDGLGLSGRTRIIIITHAAFESGWGFSQGARVNNFFNISSGRSWKGKTITGADTEYAPGVNQPKPIVQHWRVYDSDADAIKDYLDVLTYARYLPARAALIDGDPEGFVRLLGPDRANDKPPVGGYYTLPTNRYLAGFNEKMSEVMKLVDEGLYGPPASNPPPICL